MHYALYDGDIHVTFYCETPIPGGDGSDEDRFRLRGVGRGDARTWTLEPVEIAHALTE